MTLRKLLVNLFIYFIYLLNFYKLLPANANIDGGKQRMERKIHSLQKHYKNT